MKNISVFVTDSDQVGMQYVCRCGQEQRVQVDVTLLPHRVRHECYAKCGEWNFVEWLKDAVIIDGMRHKYKFSIDSVEATV